MKKFIIISIIIKALNEEQNIERAIRSSIEATKGMPTEIILADSLSTDRTIAIAKRFPIRIVQLRSTKDRSCGVGPQLGYQHTTGDFVYILDGDMELEKGFLKVAIDELKKDDKLAGVAGHVQEMRAQNIVFERRKRDTKKRMGAVCKLNMGGLYRQKALKDVGYFSNRNLHAYEEAELGLRLTSKGWKLKRIDAPGIRHYGYDTTSFGVFAKRWRTRYVKGSGDYLRSCIGKPYFLKAAKELKIYIGVILWWIIMGISFALLPSYPSFFPIYAEGTFFAFIIFAFKKRSLREALFSLVSWHYSSVGMVWGLLSPQKDPSAKIPSRVIR